MDEWEKDRHAAAQWAYEVLYGECLIVDTETTGLERDAEIVQIAILDSHGHTILESLVHPVGAIPVSAYRIHGITSGRVCHAAYWRELWPAIRSIVAHRHVVIYNKEFDIRLLYQSCQAAGLTEETAEVLHDLAFWDCAMVPYSAFIGDWNDYYGNYRRQKLPGGDHSAIGDCRATLAVLKTMAASRKEEPNGQTAL